MNKLSQLGQHLQRAPLPMSMSKADRLLCRWDVQVQPPLSLVPSSDSAAFDRAWRWAFSGTEGRAKRFLRVCRSRAKAYSLRGHRQRTAMLAVCDLARAIEAEEGELPCQS